MYVGIQYFTSLSGYTDQAIFQDSKSLGFLLIRKHADKFLTKVGRAISETRGEKCQKWLFGFLENGASDVNISKSI